MFFYEIHSHFYLICGLLLALITLYKLKNLNKPNSSLFLSFLALLIYVFRSANALAYSLTPYKSYYLYLAAFVYTIQSIMLLAAVEFITSKFSRGQQDSKDNFTTRRDLTEFKEYLLRDKKSLAMLVLWNLSFYGILALSEIFYHPYIARFGSIFLVTSYWVAAHHLNVLSLILCGQKKLILISPKFRFYFFLLLQKQNEESTVFPSNLMKERRFAKILFGTIDNTLGKIKVHKIKNAKENKIQKPLLRKNFLAHKGLNPEMINNEEVKRKLDIVVTMLTMIGFVNLVSTLFQPLVARYMIAIQASLYIFEVIATAYTSDLFNGKPKVVGGILQYSPVSLNKV